MILCSNTSNYDNIERASGGGLPSPIIIIIMFILHYVVFVSNFALANVITLP